MWSGWEVLSLSLYFPLLYFKMYHVLMLWFMAPSFPVDSADYQPTPRFRDQVPFCTDKMHSNLAFSYRIQFNRLARLPPRLLSSLSLCSTRGLGWLWPEKTHLLQEHLGAVCCPISVCVVIFGTGFGGVSPWEGGALWGTVRRTVLGIWMLVQMGRVSQIVLNLFSTRQTFTLIWSQLLV